MPRALNRKMEDDKVEDDLVQEVYTCLTVKRYPDGVSEGKESDKNEGLEFFDFRQWRVVVHTA